MLNILPPGHPYARQDVERVRSGPLRKTFRRPWWVWLITVVGLGIVLYVLAAAGVFFAVRWHWTDVPGGIDPNAQEYNQLAAATAAPVSLPDVLDTDAAETRERSRLTNCRLDVLRRAWPRNALLIEAANEVAVNIPLETKMIFAAYLRMDSASATRQVIDDCAQTDFSAGQFGAPSNNSLYPWANAEEWGIVAAAFEKDRAVIERVSQETGVPARMIVSVAMVEQLRLYYTEREMYKKFFQPLKILGNATQFAWGVMAIKEKTALDIERHAQSPHDAFYPGPGFAARLALPATDPEKERFARLTNERNHYYSYVYGATELAEISAQWRRAGFPISDRPEILATLFNIGFGRSKPSSNPQVGGSTISIAGVDYSFGGLAFEWYYSGELLNLFPYPSHE